MVGGQNDRLRGHGLAIEMGRQVRAEVAGVVAGAVQPPFEVAAAIDPRHPYVFAD